MVSPNQGHMALNSINARMAQNSGPEITQKIFIDSLFVLYTIANQVFPSILPPLEVHRRLTDGWMRAAFNQTRLVRTEESLVALLKRLAICS